MREIFTLVDKIEITKIIPVECQVTLTLISRIGDTLWYTYVEQCGNRGIFVLSSFIYLNNIPFSERKVGKFLS